MANAQHDALTTYVLTPCLYKVLEANDVAEACKNKPMTTLS